MPKKTENQGCLKRALKLLNIAEILTRVICKEKGMYSNLDAMGTYSIIWDFDGTLLPSDPYDSEQTLMLHKLNETGENICVILRTIARMMIYADNKEHLRKSFKRFYVWLFRYSTAELVANSNHNRSYRQ